MERADELYRPTPKRINMANKIGRKRQKPPPAQDSPEHILNALNDDCLCEIFQKIDDFTDFNPIASVCVRFNKIAKLVFPPKIRSRWVYFYNWIIGEFIHDDIIKLTHHIGEIEKFLCNFGSSIVSLKYTPYYMEELPHGPNSVLKMVDKYCTNLRCLNIEITNEQDEILNEIRSICSKLTVLHIHVPVQDIISFCPNLEELVVHNWRSEFQMPDTLLPCLKIFRTRDSTSFGNQWPTLQRFLSRNSQIEEIEFNEKCTSVHSEAIQFISQNMLNLKTIKLFAHSLVNIDDLNLLSHTTIILGSDRFAQITAKGYRYDNKNIEEAGAVAAISDRAERARRRNTIRYMMK